MKTFRNKLVPFFGTAIATYGFLITAIHIPPKPDILNNDSLYTVFPGFRPVSCCNKKGGSSLMVGGDSTTEYFSAMETVSL
jgi:hypothetical protein